MERANSVELPDGHVVDLAPRPPQHQVQYKAYRVGCTSSAQSASESTDTLQQIPTPEPEASLETMPRKGKATKLPLPKSISKRSRDLLNQTPSPTAIPKPSPTAFSSGGSGGGDLYWRKIREKFEKESPLSQRTSYHRTREGDRAASASLAESLQKIKTSVSAAHNKSKESHTKGRTGIPSPSTKIRVVSNPRSERYRYSEGKKNWVKEGDQWIIRDADDSALPPYELKQSETKAEWDGSISPISTEEGSTEWEDRFVVHMPSAKEPNPPTMTEDQIAEYQKSISYYRGDDRLLDPTEKPSRHESPVVQHSSLAQRDGALSPFKAYDGRQSPAQQADQQPPSQSQFQSPGPHGQGIYYSPDEIGKNRISTIWEESSGKVKEKRTSHGDGSFLGCKEIDAAATKNPDEILLFATGEDSTHLQPRPLAVGAKKRLREKKVANRPARKSEEKATLQKEWLQDAQNTRHAQGSKQSSTTICKDQNCPQPDIPRSDSQYSIKENSLPRQIIENPMETIQEPRGDDDVFIITPTITRTLIPTPTPNNTPEKLMSLPKLRRLGGTGQTGTGKAVKAVRAKAQVITTPSTPKPAPTPLPIESSDLSLESSETIALDATSPSKKAQAKEKSSKEKAKDTERSSSTSNAIRGFIRTSGLARTTGMVRSPTDSLAQILRNGTESLRNRAESLRNGTGSFNRKGSPVSQSSLPTRDNSESSISSKSSKSDKSVKETPISSTKPSPAEVETPVSKKVTVKVKPMGEKPPRDKSTPEKSSKEKTREKSPALKPSSPLDKPLPVINTTPPPPEKLRNSIDEKSPSEQREQLSRAEKLERFKERARAHRRSTLEIAELEGHQVTDRKDLHPSITNIRGDFSDLSETDKDGSLNEGSSPFALTLILQILFLSVAQIHKYVLRSTENAYVKFLIVNVSNMTSHCCITFCRVYRIISVYQATGQWPKPENDQAIGRFLIDLLQAVVYVFILGFGCMIISRAAGYVALVWSWIIWFAKPLGWTCHCVGHSVFV
ncbi:hypothetical protein N7495_000328 [Penicillium taxi]|uniref:uncharacterized protein n=1 Tax=Penicillium taxi TaxID=168475 RepID=UPI00254544AF|nr:uncharacterized protein N7495_000328 [Penicillium taxi]KAJ5907646.1 hypothetical protein N7495_000328 [Penicillium taxi]